MIMKNLTIDHISQLEHHSKTKPQRNPNIELLRIVSMLMILVLHYLNQGGSLWDVTKGSSNYYLIWIIEAICYVSVNCYMLISGYFLWKTKFKLNKLVSFWLTGAFYSIILFALCIATNLSEFSVQGLCKAVFHVSGRANWYVTVYFALYCLLPLLNYAIQSMSKKELRMVIGATLILFSLIPTVLFFWDAFGVSDGYSLLWYINMYLIGAYLNRFCCDKIKSMKTSILILGMFSILLLPSLKFSVELLSAIIPSISGCSNILYKYNSIPVVIASLSMFCLFSRITICQDKITRLINSVAKTTFAIFIIHTHFSLRDSLWVLLGSKSVMNSPWIWLHLIVCIIIVFVFCSFIEFGRMYLFNCLKIEGAITKISDKLQKIIDKERLVEKND